MNSMESGLRDLPSVDKGPWIERFGEDADSWNTYLGPIGFNPHSGVEPMFDDEDDEDDIDGDGSGLPGIRLVTQALRTLAACWGDFDAASAARAFNLPRELVEQCAVEGRFDAEPDEVHVADLASLLSALIGCRSHDGASVALLARITNQHPTRLIEAVGSHPYLFLSGDRDNLDELMIELDGE